MNARLFGHPDATDRPVDRAHGFVAVLADGTAFEICLPRKGRTTAPFGSV